MIIRILLLIVITSITVSSKCFADNDSMWLAGIDIPIGASKEQIVSMLEKTHVLEQFPVSIDDRYFIRNKGGEIIGQIAFTNGKVSSIARDWGNYHGSDAHDLGEALFIVLSNLEKSGRKHAVISTETSLRSPGISLEVITLVFGAKEITVTVVSGSKIQEQVYVQEAVGRQ